VRGPYLLRPLQVDIAVPSRLGGVYCLGKNSRHVDIVGRAEQNLRDTIKAHWKEFEFFWFEPSLTARECYLTQCRHYHKQMDNGGLKDPQHPKAPDRVDSKCPICGQ